MTILICKTTVKEVKHTITFVIFSKLPQNIDCSIIFNEMYEFLLRNYKIQIEHSIIMAILAISLTLAPPLQLPDHLPLDNTAFH